MSYKSEYTKMLLEQAKRGEQKILDESTNTQKNTVVNEYSQITESNINKVKQVSGLYKDIKRNLLYECMLGLYDLSLASCLESANTETMKANIVNDFINEHGVDTILNRCRVKSYFLSEMVNVIEEYHSIIKNDLNVFLGEGGSPGDYTPSSEIKKSFYKELEAADPQSVASLVKTRVKNAIEEFVNTNVSEREEAKEILIKTQEKVNSTNNKAMKESYEMQGKRALSSLNQKKVTTVFESLVYNFTNKVMVTEALQDIYYTDNRIDMESVVEGCEVVYTFLEMVNTFKFVDNNENSVKKIVESFKF